MSGVGWVVFMVGGLVCLVVATLLLSLFCLGRFVVGLVCGFGVVGCLLFFGLFVGGMFCLGLCV